MSNLVKRILTCIIGVPAVLAFIFVFPQYNFIALSSLIILLTFLGCIEMSKILFAKFTLPALLPPFYCLLYYLNNLFEFTANLTTYYLVFSIVLILATEIKCGEKDDFSSSLTRLSRSLFLLIYPGFLLSFVLSMLSSDTTTSYSISLFLLLVFSNDIFAYVFGMLLGRKHSGIVKVSPKKSLEGFIGGTAGCLLVCLACFHFMNLPEIKIYLQLALALVTSITANIGDLAESVLKRSAGIKDSGRLIPGRGGILDCIDSIIVSAPFFYIFWELIN